MSAPAPTESTTTTYLVTGASRGLGLAYVRAILEAQPNARVIAAARDPSTADKLQGLVKEFEGRIECLTLDLADKAKIRKAAEEAAELTFAEEGIDVLINNAAIFAGAYGDALAPGAIDTLESNLQINLVGVAATSLAFLPLLRKGCQKRIWTISSTGGSIGGPWGDLPMVATYAASKAGLNMWSHKLAMALKPEVFTVVNLCPGLVKTDMTHGEGELEPIESARMGLEVLSAQGIEQTGRFVNHKGETVLW